MTKRYDTTGRPLTATDWAAIRNIPALVSQFGAAADPGNGLWLVEYNGTTDSFTFTSASALTVTAPNVSYTSTGSQWTATDVQTALHMLEAEVDHLENITVGVVTEVSGNFAITLSGMSSGGTGTIYYTRTGSKVTLMARAAVTGTSNSASMDFSLPGGLVPAHTQLFPCMQIEDNGNIAAQSAYCQVDAGTGKVSFGLFGGANGQGTTFTTSGTKGILAGWAVTFDLAA